MLALRFAVGLGVGGMWPNGIALVSECWPKASKPLISGVMAAGLNAGILLLSQLARAWPVTPDSWRWIFQLSGVPALLGMLILLALPESPEWRASRLRARRPAPPLQTLFGPALLGVTLAAIVVSVIPMMGAWAASKWMIPWADKVAGSAHAEYKAVTQGWWALGAMVGAVGGAQLASWLGRRRSYLLISLGATMLTVAMFQLTAPLRPGFLLVVFLQRTVANLFFGWLAVYLPDYFRWKCGRRAADWPTTPDGLARRSGCWAPGGDYARVGAICALIYGLSILAIWLVREPAPLDKPA